MSAASDACLTWTDDDYLPGFAVASAPASPVLAGAPAASVAAGRSDPIYALVRRTAQPRRARGVVVHLHGYNDYFFQTHLADAVEGAGWAFLALDARRAGRAWRLGEVPHYQDDLREQGTDLTAAVTAARLWHPGLPVVVHGHSTGGLVAALWAHAHRERGGVEGLILNSPFLGATGAFVPVIGDEVLRALARLRPLTPLSGRPSRYAAHLLKQNGGLWEFDTRLKRPEGVPARAGWLSAVRQGQTRVARGLEIGCPVLVAHSDASANERDPNAELDRQDAVLDVATIAKLAIGLGPDVEDRTIPGGIHDLTLSADKPRAAYFAAMAEFLHRIAA
ncbi:MAG: alpha/beta hydrolase [Micrococcales bacterium]|nr:alpha/beta hydrolase [Micrococcales bacterium]